MAGGKAKEGAGMGLPLGKESEGPEAVRNALHAAVGLGLEVAVALRQRIGIAAARENQ